MIRRFVPLLTLWLLACLSALAQPLAPETKTRTLDALTQTITRRAFVPGIDFARLTEFLEKQKPALEAASDATAFSAAVNRALREFGISHVRLLTPRAATARATGRNEDFGLVARPVGDGTLAVVTVAGGGPADKIGIAVGDVITEVEMKAPAISIEQGDRETSLLTVRRPSSGRTRYVMLVKGSYSTVRLPTLTWPAKDVARLRLPSFTRGYDTKQIEGLLTEAARAKTLIVDLRGNGGGLVRNCTHLLSLLTPPQTPFGVSVTRELAERYAKETGGAATEIAKVAAWAGTQGAFRRSNRPPALAPFAGKLIVLTDRRSASASEITAAVLKEQRGATLIGRPTAGAVLTSVFLRLPDGFEVQIPISDYVTPGGRRLEANPLPPDIAVEAPAAAPRTPPGAEPTDDEAADPVIAAALKKAAER